jgi:hypothetical protein
MTDSAAVQPGTAIQELVIDELMPRFDADVAEHLIVRATPATTFASARGLDFLRVRTPLLDAALWLRELPARATGHAAATPPRLVLAEGDPLPGWLVLGERAGHEIVFGAVGRFWQPRIEWREVTRDGFATFAEPGWGKIAANFTVTPYGSHATLLTYECRTVTTDADTRRRFLRYWRLVHPFVGHIFRATVRTIRADAEAHDAGR